jgi:hypothetical protein
MDRACSMDTEKRNEYRILVGKPGGKIPLGRPRRRWVDNIKIDLREGSVVVKALCCKPEGRGFKSR